MLKSVKKCGNTYTLHFIHDNKYTVARARCHSWRCPVCGPKKRDLFRHSIAFWAQKFDLRRMLTLTLPSSASPDDVKLLRRGWARFRLALFKKYGRSNVHFICITEFSPDGRAHLHCLISRYLSQGWVSSVAVSCGLGKICDIRAVDVHRVISYVSKYFTKSFMVDFPSRARRFTTSQSIVLSPKKERVGWFFQLGTLQYFYDRFKGFFSTINSSGQILASPSGTESFCFPFISWEFPFSRRSFLILSELL